MPVGHMAILSANIVSLQRMISAVMCVMTCIEYRD